MFIPNNINGVIVNGYDTDTVTQHGFALYDLSCDMREGVFGVNAKKKKKKKKSKNPDRLAEIYPEQKPCYILFCSTVPTDFIRGQ